jgi:Zn-dependent protease/predicted transcriptional regulator
MKSSLRIATVAGIGIFLHWTFGLLFVGVFAYFVLVLGTTAAAAMWGVLLMLLVFGCVVLHELGHALMARRFDVPTKDITLYPIGGIARLQRIPEEPLSEFWIALAGPAVNVVIAAVLYGVIVAFEVPLQPEGIVDPGWGFVSALFWLNVILVLFNMLPAFPMDGGRVLRSLLATRINYVRATQIASSIGQGMAILFGIIGLLYFNPVLLFIAFFVFIGAQQEAQHAMMRAVTQGVPVRQAMMTRFVTLEPGDGLKKAIDELLAGSDQDFPVVEDGRVVGVLTRKQLMKAISEQGTGARVMDVVEGGAVTIEDSVMLDDAFRAMQESEQHTMPVVRGGRLVGLLTLENVGELMMINSALQQAGVRGDVGKVLGKAGLTGAER